MRRLLYFMLCVSFLVFFLWFEADTVPTLVRDFSLSDFHRNHIEDALALPCFALAYNVLTKRLSEGVRDFLTMLAPVLTIAIAISAMLAAGELPSICP